MLLKMNWKYGLWDSRITRERERKRRDDSISLFTFHSTTMTASHLTLVYNLATYWTQLLDEMTIVSP